MPQLELCKWFSRLQTVPQGHSSSYLHIHPAFRLECYGRRHLTPTPYDAPVRLLCVIHTRDGFSLGWTWYEIPTPTEVQLQQLCLSRSHGWHDVLDLGQRKGFDAGVLWIHLVHLTDLSNLRGGSGLDLRTGGFGGLDCLPTTSVGHQV